MERPVIFLQFMLVLVMAIHVIYSCDCVYPRTMEESICAGEALVMATPLSVKMVGVNMKYVDDLKLALFYEYDMFINTIYDDGPHDLDHNFNMTIYSPLYCHAEFDLKLEYYFAGVKDGEASLVVTNCDYVERVDWEVHHDEHEEKNDFLTRHIDVDCSTFQN